MNLQQLKDPMPFQWKVQAFTPKAEKKTGCICVGYIDARDVQDRLDAVVGPENWQCKFSQNKNNLFCAIGIRIGPGPADWVWKEDCGTESDMEAEKGEASDAFKRAAVKWGVGRFLYELPEMRLKVAENGKSYMPADDHGQPLWGKDKLSAFCTAQMRKPVKAPVKVVPAEPAKEDASLPKLSPEQKTRLSRIFNFVKENYHNGKAIDAKDFGKAVYLILGHWPDSAADEETVLSTIKIEVDNQDKQCASDGKLPLKQAS
jgi:hypothetical protein